jgi:hypothetical protein
LATLGHFRLCQGSLHVAPQSLPTRALGSGQFVDSGWSDWVRSHHAAGYNKGTWHYVNYPYIPPGSKVDPAKHQPPADQVNVVTILNRCPDKIRNGTDIEKTVYMCWLFHLTGDIAQPLHCVAMFSEEFPNGDQGGNLVSVRLTGRPNKLHSLWDGLLGNGVTPAAINRDVQLIEAVMKEKADTIGPELESHKTPESWALEGAELAKKAVYLNGELKLAKSSGRNTNGDDAPQAPADYGANAGRVARVQIGKAGTRLAGQLANLFP